MLQDKDLDLDKFARLVVDALERLNIDYMLGGAIALWAYGDMRTTQDVDLVVDLPDHILEPLSAELLKLGMMVPADIMRDNIAETRIDLAINAIHPFSGNKAELFPVRADDEFRSGALKRRVLVELPGVIGKVYVHSPEDLILNKLIYYKISFQTKHNRDIKAILKSGTLLDHAYIEHWAALKGVLPVWQEILKA
jgi:hypothetical protein